MPEPVTPGETHYKLLRVLEANPELSQRQLAEALGISLGSTNYALRAVLERGWVKAKIFKRSDNKRAYLYKLTPAGIRKKAQLAYRYLQQKREEHETLWREIEELRAEVEQTRPTEDGGGETRR